LRGAELTATGAGCVGEQDGEGLVEPDLLGGGHDAVRASPLPARVGASLNPGSQGQLSRSDAHSFSYSLGPPTKGLSLVSYLFITGAARTGLKARPAAAIVRSRACAY